MEGVPKIVKGKKIDQFNTRERIRNQMSEKCNFNEAYLTNVKMRKEEIDCVRAC